MIIGFSTGFPGFLHVVARVNASFPSIVVICHPCHMNMSPLLYLSYSLGLFNPTEHARINCIVVFLPQVFSPLLFLFSFLVNSFTFLAVLTTLCYYLCYYEGKTHLRAIPGRKYDWRKTSPSLFMLMIVVQPMTLNPSRDSRSMPFCPSIPHVYAVLEFLAECLVVCLLSIFLLTGRFAKGK